MDWTEFLYTNWPIKLVSVVLIIAAWIDGKDLRVPNYITLPMILTGVIFQTAVGGFAGMGAGLLGMCVGLMCLLPLYAVGGMGAGDVKLMAGIGAWVGWQITAYSFAVSVVVGAFMAVVMVAVSGDWKKHYKQCLLILSEWSLIKNPYELSEIATERKARMYLLPYGIPICIGTIGYFIHAGLI